MLQSDDQKNRWVETILHQKTILAKELVQLPNVVLLYPSDANFILAKTVAAKKIYDALVERQIVVRDRSRVSLCGECLRITVGTADENQLLIKAMKKIGKCENVKM